MSPLVSTAAGGRPYEVTSKGIDPHPTLDPGDVLVAVEATPLGPADFVLRDVWFLVLPELARVLGAERVARVLQAGAPTHLWLVGRRVVLLSPVGRGTPGALGALHACEVVPLWERVDAVQVAFCPAPAPTGYSVLRTVFRRR